MAEGAIHTLLSSEADPKGFKTMTDALMSLSMAHKVALGSATALAIGGLALTTAKAIELEEQFSTLRRLTDEDIFEGVKEDVLDLSANLPLAREEVISITEEAVRLGVEGRENIRSFTRAVGQLATATQLEAGQAANSIAKIARVTDASIEDTRRLTSSINELSKNYGTSAEEIVKATGKLAPVARQMGFTAEQTLGIAAALNEVNISVRRGATRLRRFFQQSLNPKKQQQIANAIGLTADKFRRLMNTSEGAQQIMQRVVATMAAGEEGAEMLRVTLSSASRQGVSTLANNLERLPDAIETAEDAARDGTSAMREEFIETTKTTAQLSIAQERLSQFWVGDEGILKAPIAISNLSSKMSEMLTKVRETDPALANMALNLDQVRKDADLSAEGTFAFLNVAEQLANELEGPKRELFLSEVVDILEENNFRWSQATVELGEFQTGLEGIDSSIEDFINKPWWQRGLIPMLMSGSDGGAGGGPEDERTIRERIDDIISSFEGLGDTTGEQRNKFESMWDAAKTNLTDEQLAPFVREMEALVNKSIPAEEKLERLRSYLDSNGILTEAAKSAKERFEELRTSLMETRLEMVNITDESLENKEGWDDLSESQQENLKRMRDLNSLYRKTSMVLGEVDGTLQQLGITARQANIQFPDFDDTPIGSEDFPLPPEQEKRLEEFEQQMNNFDLTSMQAQMDMLRETTREMTDAFFEMFDALLDRTEDVEDAILDMISSISQAIASSIIQKFLMQQGASILAPGGVGDAPLKPENVGVASPTQAQHGGSFEPGQAMLVGEAGPELVVPKMRGTVVPNRQLKKGGGSPNIYRTNVQFSVKAMDSRDVQRMLDENKELITDRVVEGISRSQARRRQLR